jgi:hypothetical protein
MPAGELDGLIGELPDIIEMVSGGNVKFREAD